MVEDIKNEVRCDDGVLRGGGEGDLFARSARIGGVIYEAKRFHSFKNDIFTGGELGPMCAVGRIVGRRLDHRREICGLCGREVLCGFTEIRPGGGFHPIERATVRDSIEIHLENLLLGIYLF